MHSHGPRPDPLTDLGYEPADVNMRKLGMALAFFFGFAFFCVFAAYFIIKLMDPSYFDQRADVGQLTKHIPAPPNPLLQTDVTTKTDIRDLRQQEEVALTTPGWVDQPKGIVRIPIDRAIDLTVERAKSGAPTTSGSNATPPPAAATTPKVNGG